MDKQTRQTGGRAQQLTDSVTFPAADLLSDTPVI